MNYLLLLQERSKWRKVHRNAVVNDVVLVKDDYPRNSWALGVVQKVFMDKSGCVRMVDVKTRCSVVRRPITKLSLILEGDCQSF